MTPEGRVKAKVKAVLDACRPHVYYTCPVQQGMGTPTLDFIGCAAGMYFSIETKAEGKLPTPRQKITIGQTHAASGAVFIIAGTDPKELRGLKVWLAKTLKERLSLP